MWSIKCLCWINMDGCVSSQQVLDYFHGLKRVSVCHPSTLRSASVVSHITLLHSLACSGNEGLPSARFRGCGALAFELGSSQLSSLFSRALPQVVLTHSTFTWLHGCSSPHCQCVFLLRMKETEDPNDFCLRAHSQSSWGSGKGTLWSPVVHCGLSAYVSKIIFVFLSEHTHCRF